jgi:hypothetical protein
VKTAGLFFNYILLAYTMLDILSGRFSVHFAALVCASLLTACGGGGGGSVSPVAPLTQDQVRGAALVAYNTPATFEIAISEAAIVAAASLAGASSANEGSSSGTELCTQGGSLSVRINKSQVRVGYALGDSLSLTFNNCVEDSVLRAGAIVIRPSTAVGSTDPNNIAGLAFEMDLDKYRGAGGVFSSGSVKVTSHTQTASSLSSRYQSVGQVSVAEPSLGLSLFVTGLTQTAPSTVAIGGNKTFAFNGNFSVLAPNAPMITFSLNTSTSVVVPVATQVPIAGAIRLTGLSVGPAAASTNLSIGPTLTSVSADTDGNGSADLSFQMTNSALTGV